MKIKLARLSLPLIGLVVITLGVILGGVAAYATVNYFTLSDGNNLLQSYHSDNIWGYYQYSYWKSVSTNVNSNYVYVSNVINSNGSSNHPTSTKWAMCWIWAQNGTTRSVYDFWGYTIYGSYVSATINQGWDITPSYPLEIQQNIMDGTDPLAEDWVIANR
jgi:hypothetical protein